MRLAVGADIKRMDERAEKEFGLSRLVLMENAGLAAVLAIERVLGSVEGKRIAILCGRGGNGGDGMCAARHFVSHGASIVTGLVGSKADLKGETLANWEILSRMGLAPSEILGEDELPWVRAACGASDIVVDALLGVGARLPLEGVMDQVVRAMNASGKPVVSIDVPTGMNADTGHIPGNAVAATLTVALGLPKRGHVLYPGTLRVGRLVVADLTLPIALLTDPAIMTDVLLPEEAGELVPVRHPQMHKHQVGRALVVAGSRAMPGAAALAAESALVGGAGMVYLAAPASGLGGGRRAEIIVRPQAETPGGWLAEAAIDELLSTAREMHAVAMGPGLGAEETTKKAVRRLVGGMEAPMVVDADALNALAGNIRVLHGAPAPRILTPHAGEMARLLESTVEEVEADRIEAGRRGAREFNAIVVLKGARTVVAEPGGRVFVVSTGNPGMATAGTGDVLTGLICALLAQRVPPFSAALLGAHVHGLAGDLARNELTELSLTASDLTARIPAAFKRLISGGDQSLARKA